MNRTLRIVMFAGIGGLVLSMGFSSAVAEGTLDAFETGTVNRSTESPPGHNAPQHHHSGYSSDDWGFLMEAVGVILVAGGQGSMERATGLGGSELEMREPGEPGLPVLRLDLGYRHISSRLHAMDARVEAGFGPLGAHVSFSRYWERDPRDELNLIQAFGLYRMSFGEVIEVDLGIGSQTIRGARSDTRWVTTIPVRIYPTESLGLEYRPSWADGLNDHDLALLLVRNPVAIKLGYRWVTSPGASLDGPYIGMLISL